MTDTAVETGSKDKHTVHWFRKGLRLHDNPSLMEGLKTATTFRCVFIIDPWFAGSSNVGINKWRFLLQCLEDLDRSLRRLNSRLFVVRGQPADALPKLFREWGTTNLTFEEDPEPYGRVRDHNITALCKENGISVVTKVSHTLYELDKIIEKNGGRAPLTYHQFQSVIAGMGAPSPAEATIMTETLGVAITPLNDDHDDKYGVPTLEELGFDTEGLKPPVWEGGESEALARLDRHLERKAWVASFGRPKMTPQSLLASQTGLSPYLRFGCLSTRLFYYQLTELYKKIKKARPPLSLHGQLLWREFFYCAATKNPNFDKMVGNPICVQIPWDKNCEALAKWANGQTGYPWIDAIMIQLREEGWIHHLARHAVACFLTRGDLWISWEEGMKVFDELLLDADWSVNAGTWMWLSCSSFFQQFFHCYCPVRFGRKADPNGDYIRKYVTVLKNFPARYIHSPWLAPQSVQTAARCIIGQDYPMPMVDHGMASKSNIQRIKQVYHQLSKYRPQEIFAADNNRSNIIISSPSPNTIITSVNHSNYYCITPDNHNNDIIYGQQNQNEEQENQSYLHNKKQDEDFEQGNKTVSDIFTEKQTRNASGLQVRNLPFKKIVVVDQNYEDMKQKCDEINRNNENDINNQYTQQFKQSPGRSNEYHDMPRQSNFYTERLDLDSSYDKMKDIIEDQEQKYNESPQITTNEYNNYTYKNEMETNQKFVENSTDNFKQPLNHSVYNMKSKSYCLGSNHNNVSYDPQTDNRAENDNGRFHQQNYQKDYSSSSNNIHSSFDYTPQTYMDNLQRYDSRNYQLNKSNLNYDRTQQNSMQDEVGMQMQGVSSQQELSSDRHDCSTEEERCRFQQGKVVMMQGCNRPYDEPE